MEGDSSHSPAELSQQELVSILFGIGGLIPVSVLVFFLCLGAIESVFAIHVPYKTFRRAKSRRTGAIQVLTKKGANFVGWNWVVASPPYSIQPEYEPFRFFIEGENGAALISGTIHVDVVDTEKYQMSRDDEFTQVLENLVVKNLREFESGMTLADLQRLVPGHEMEPEYGVRVRVDISDVVSLDDFVRRELRRRNRPLSESFW